VSIGSCPSSDDTSNVFVTPTALIGISDTAICIENGPITLNGTTPLSDQSVSWLFLSGTGHLSNVQSATTLLEEVGVGANILTYTMSHDQCPTTVDTVTIVASLCDGFNPIIPTVITPNFDGLNDLFVINYLDLIYPECNVLIFNRWGSVVYESIGYQDPWDGTYKGEDLPMGTYFYKVELNDSESTVYNGSISIIR
jgi:gliding motility-associated-like protein